MSESQEATPAGGRPQVVGELVEYRPGEWLRASAVLAVGPELSELVRKRRQEEAGSRERAGLPPGPEPEPTRLKVINADEWWHSPHSVDALVQALAVALENAGGRRG